MFDPHIHMTSRTTDDYRALHAADTSAALSLQLALRGMAASARKSVGAEIVGVDPASYAAVSDLPRHLVEAVEDRR